MEKLVDDILKENYPVFHHHFLEFFTAHLTDCSKAFDGDLEGLLILAIMDARFWRNRYSEFYGKEMAIEAPEKFTVTRLSEITKIPRETVRRKLLALEKRGWVTREGRDWQMAQHNDKPSVENDLDNLVRLELKRVVKLVRALKGYV